MLNYLSFKCSHACSLSGIHGGVLWKIFDDFCFSEISQPCFDPVVIAGVCITSKYFFVKFKRGNLSDGWRLDWCVCRKSVNNINFIWINKKVGSGNSHVGFFFFSFSSDTFMKLINFWGKKQDINQSFELMTPKSFDSKSSFMPNFFTHFVKDVLNNLSSSGFFAIPYSGCVQSCTLIAEIACQLCSNLYTVHFYGINTGASWSLSLQGKTDTTSEARCSLKAPWDHTQSLTSKKCPHGYS